MHFPFVLHGSLYLHISALLSPVKLEVTFKCVCFIAGSNEKHISFGKAQYCHIISSTGLIKYTSELWRKKNHSGPLRLAFESVY